MSESVSFADQENLILNHWDKIDAFHESVRRSAGKPEFTFYDGPPFATGLPHYGHILAGAIKDVITRYAHQTGHYVPRKFGWDCHGLPIEFEIEKDLGIKTREEVLELGIAQYNDHCESIVMRYSAQWEQIVKRLGRWIDFKNDYKTMDASFMESVWHVFKQLFDKGLIYRGNKVTPYSTACGTPLANFEADQNKKKVSDPAIVVSFPLDSDPEVSLLAWTTTPWTLPSNLALCVNASITYVKVTDKKTRAKYILAKSRLEQLYSMKDEPAFEILSEFPGLDLQGLTYAPIFPYFSARKETGAFRVLVDNYVSVDNGTGIVHLAPAFGEDDERVCRSAGIVTKDVTSMLCPIDANGRFTSEVPDYEGVYIKDADVLIMDKLKNNGRLIRKESIAHIYPFCWRSDTPLIQRAVPSWFVAVETFKDKIIANNEQTYWVPEMVKENRFKKWLINARDWCVARNRFWGTPIPLWVSDDFEEVVCVGSIEELYQLSGKKVENLHRQYVDHITIPSKHGKGLLRRVDEVFDCWFESGSMPYGQVHYPFENETRFTENFPADFIAEGIDQTRGWFYSLMVISTALFDKPAFKNVIVNGIVLAADGKKMSKRLKNYPDPMDVIKKYGADALRVYLINSPLVSGDDIKFREEGVEAVVKDVLLPWFHTWQFFDQCVRDLAQHQNTPFMLEDSLLKEVDNVLDKWVIMEINQLVASVRQKMEKYELQKVVPLLLKFIQMLTNFYVRLNRKRLKGTEGTFDNCKKAVTTLGNVLLTVAVAMAPLTPFFSEWVYLKMAEFLPNKEDSVHFLPYPTPVRYSWMESASAVTAMTTVLNSVIVLGRTLRDQQKLPVKLPLKSATVVHYNELGNTEAELLKQYVMTELNVKRVELTRDESSYVQFSAVLNFKKKGDTLKSAVVAVGEAVKKLSHNEIHKAMKDNSMSVLGHELSMEDLIVRRSSIKVDSETIWDQHCTLILDTTVDASQRCEWIMRQVVNHIQKIRKSLGLKNKDHINMHVSVDHKEVIDMIGQWKEHIERAVEVTLVSDPSADLNENTRLNCTKSLRYHDELVTIKFVMLA